MLIALGFALLLSPFLLLSRFQDKKIGIVTILTLVIAFQLALAFVTQLFGIFYYAPILISNILFSFVVIFLLLKKTHKNIDFKKMGKAFLRMDFALILLIAVAAFYLLSVHYNYSGKYLTVEDVGTFKTAAHLKYPYPYYSDEWYSVAFIKNSIASGGLPVKNLFYVNIPENIRNKYYHDNADQNSLNTYYFNNLELPFHSFLAELTLLLKLDPLKNYILLSVGINLTILMLIYLFLRLNGISKLTANIATLSALFITNSANLPGLWYLAPLNMGILSMMLSLIFMSINSEKMMFAAGILTLIFYPPLVVFYLPAIAFKTQKSKHILFVILTVIASSIFVSSLFFISNGKGHHFIKFVLSKIYYPSLDGPILTQFKLYDVIPIPILVIAVLGIYGIAKKVKWLIPLTLIGLGYWFVYSFSDGRFIIEYQRVIVTTSILIVIFAGFGMEWVKKMINKNETFKQYHLTIYLQIAILLMFLLLYQGYTQRENWLQFYAYNQKTGVLTLPASPANTYLLTDDLRIFGKIKNKTFLSIPWKSTVIAVVTGNKPRTIKSGTLSLHKDLYQEFMAADCTRKAELAKYYYFELVYSTQFSCPDFKSLDKSSGGLFLYKYINHNYFPN